MKDTHSSSEISNFISPRVDHTTVFKRLACSEQNNKLMSINYIHVDDNCFSETSIFCYTVVITFLFLINRIMFPLVMAQ